MIKSDLQLPKWLELRHSILWDAFGELQFNMEDAVNVLTEKNKDKKDEIPVFLSELRKAGWLKAEMDPKDGRKTIYK